MILQYTILESRKRQQSCGSQLEVEQFNFARKTCLKEKEKTKEKTRMKASGSIQMENIELYATQYFGENNITKLMNSLELYRLRIHQNDIPNCPATPGPFSGPGLEF